MSNIASTDITVTVEKLTKLESSEKCNYLTLAFGNGALTYPAGGIPVSLGQLGMTAFVRSLMVFDNGISAYEWSYDKTNKKLVAKQVPGVAHSHALSLKNAAVADGATTRVNAGTNLLGANTGSDITVAGGGANGGVSAATPGAATFGEPSAVAIAAQTLKVQVIGW